MTVEEFCAVKTQNHNLFFTPLHISCSKNDSCVPLLHTVSCSINNAVSYSTTYTQYHPPLVVGVFLGTFFTSVLSITLVNDFLVAFLLWTRLK